MIEIHRCQLVDGQWCRIERHHTSRGFSTMAEATEFAESLNAREWPKFDWLLGPVEAFLAIRAKSRVSPCEDDAGGGAREEE